MDGYTQTIKALTSALQLNDSALERSILDVLPALIEQRAKHWTKGAHGYFTGSWSDGAGGGSGGKGLDKSGGSGIITSGNSMAENNVGRISHNIVFAEKLYEDPHGVEQVRDFIRSELGIMNPDLKLLKNAEVMQPFVEELAAMKRQYGKAFSHISVFTADIDNRTLAETINGTLCLNGRFFNDKAATQQLLDCWEQGSRMIPAGHNSISFIARHEYMHLLTQYEIDTPKSKIVTMCSRSKAKNENRATFFVSGNASHYSGKKYYHEFVADLLATNNIKDKELLKLRNSILELISEI